MKPPDELTPTASDIIIAVDKNSANLTDDDRVLRRALERSGCHIAAQQWGETIAPRSRVLIRSTWDYIDHPERFRRWLTHLDQQQATVHNPTPLLRWNMHKGYLIELERAGIDIVPTLLVKQATTTSIAQLHESLATDDIVVKPAIGGTARLTIHTRRTTPDEAERHLETILLTEDAIVQRYVPTITSDGELSVIAIAGEVTHVVRKTPSPGDWRVQSDFGGRTHRIEVNRHHTERATQVLATLPTMPTYARIDLVHIDDHLHLMELELIEPELFFSHAPESADQLAHHLTTQRD